MEDTVEEKKIQVCVYRYMCIYIYIYLDHFAVLQKLTEHCKSSIKKIFKNRTQITNVGENVEKREPSYTVGGNINWCSQCGKQHRGFFKN